MVTFQQARSAARDTLGAVAELACHADRSLAGRPHRPVAADRVEPRAGGPVHRLARRQGRRRLAHAAGAAGGHPRHRRKATRCGCWTPTARPWCCPDTRCPRSAPNCNRWRARPSATGDLQHTGIYRPDADRPPVRLDLVVPMAAPGAASGGCRGDAARPPTHAVRPARALAGAQPDGRHRAVALAGQRGAGPERLARTAGLGRQGPFPLDTPGLPAAQVLRGEHAVDGVIDGIDFRDQPVTATARRVRDTDWLLVVKLDQAEIDAPALRSTGWIAGLAAALLAAIAAGARALARGQALQRATTRTAPPGTTTGRAAAAAGHCRQLQRRHLRQGPGRSLQLLQPRRRGRSGAPGRRGDRPGRPGALRPRAGHWNCATTTPRC
jgi:hypothetical protein